MTMTKGKVVTQEIKQARSKAVFWLFVAAIIGPPALFGLVTGEKMIRHHEADPRMAWCLDDPEVNRTVFGEGAVSGLSARDLCKVSFAVEDAR
jgi:hypothetical protein